jgi:hypothetical protein
MDDVKKARANTRFWVAAYLIACFGSAALLKSGTLTGWPGLALFAASFLLLLPLVRSVERTQQACGVNSTAMRAYNRRMIIAAFTYVALLLGSVSAAAYLAPPAPVRVALAIIVSLPVMFMIRAMALLIKEERDEYLRMRIVEQNMIATGILLAVTTIYGFLTSFDLAPRLDSFLVVPVWAVGLGIGRLFQRDASC